MSRLQLKSKASSFLITPHSLYFGSSEYTHIPLAYLTNCSYNGSLLSITYQEKKQGFFIKEGKAIQRKILAMAKSAKFTTEAAVRQLCEGMHFVIGSSMDSWSTNRSNRSNASNALYTREKKIIWTDRIFLLINNSKHNSRRVTKLLIKNIKRIIVGEYEENAYKVVVVAEERKISVYSSDFYKVRQFVAGLEYLCICSQESKYAGKPQSSAHLLFKKALRELKVFKERSCYCTYKELFGSLESFDEPIQYLTTGKEMDLKNNELSDTKKISNQLLSSVNPQSLLEESKGKLKRQLSVFSESESSLYSSSHSACGLLKQRQSPIMDAANTQSTIAKSKHLESCYGDLAEEIIETKRNVPHINATTEPYKAFTEHSFSVDRAAEVSEEINFETAKFKRPEFGSALACTEPAFEHHLGSCTESTCEESKDDSVARHLSLDGRAKLSRKIVHKQNVQLNALAAKCQLLKLTLKQQQVTQCIIIESV